MPEPGDGLGAHARGVKATGAPTHPSLSLGTTKETVRLEAFSDGVFAIAITILALEVRLPEGAEGPLANELASLWPAALAYLLSFLTILVIWLNHHALLLWVHRVQGRLLVGNGILLMLVALVPFPTALVGRYLGESDAAWALALYAALFLLIDLAFLWVWRMVHGERRRIAPTLPDAEARSTDRWLLVGIVGYAAAAAAAFVQPWASLALSMAMVLFWLYNAYRRHRVAEREGEAGQPAALGGAGDAPGQP